MHQLLEEWLDLQQENPVDQRQQAFVTRLHSAGFLKVPLSPHKSGSHHLRPWHAVWPSLLDMLLATVCLAGGDCTSWG